MAQITLFTGLPGHSKTLNAIKYVEEEYQDFSVFYFHIDEMSIPRWTLLTDPLLWHECPPKSVVVIDECHNYFPKRSGTKAAPASVLKMSEHRHLAIDLVLITQHPDKIDKDVFSLVSRHFHFFCPFGLKSATRFEWLRAQEKPFSKISQEGAVSKKTVKFDEKYFDVYKSAEIHTVKRRFPKKFLLLPLALSVSVLSIWYFLDVMHSRIYPNSDIVPTSVQSSAVYSVSVPSPSFSQKNSSSPEHLPSIRLSGVASWGDGGIAIFEIDGVNQRFSLYDANCSLSGRRWSCFYAGVEYRL
jgi:zona occludens toxin (predicted ATPase)